MLPSGKSDLSSELPQFFCSSRLSSGYYTPLHLQWLFPLVGYEFLLPSLNVHSCLYELLLITFKKLIVQILSSYLNWKFLKDKDYASCSVTGPSIVSCDTQSTFVESRKVGLNPTSLRTRNRGRETAPVPVPLLVLSTSRTSLFGEQPQHPTLFFTRP